MKKIILPVLLGAVLIQPAEAQNKVGTTAAAFLGIGTDARGLAMGSAQVALAEGPGALYWNPSGVARSRNSAVQLSSADWFLDTKYQNVALSLNTPGGTLGLNIMALQYGEFEVTTIQNPDGTGEVFEPSDLSVGLSFAKALTDRFAAGATVKAVRQKIWNETATGAAIDLGVQFRSDFQNLRIGMSMLNFGTDMRLAGNDLRESIDIDPDQNGNNPNLAANLEVDSWPMPLTFRVGVAIDAFTNETQRLTVGVDALHPNDNSESANFGVEYAFKSLLYLRGGYRQAFAEISGDGGLTGGFGVGYSVNNRIRASFDYVFMDYGDLGTPQMWTATITF
ncbi:MAG: PorV/PorQ family protein [Rhodothermales bacterium]|nr:PorV/PorQ family protein [Rhodothermales bacterium]